MQRQQQNNDYNPTSDCKQTCNDNKTTMITIPHLTVNNHAFKHINNNSYSKLRISIIISKYLQKFT